LIEAVDAGGRLTQAGGPFAGLPLDQARGQIAQALAEEGLLLGQHPVDQSVRVHERCDTPIEYVVTQQWFARVLDFREELLAVGEQIDWHPPHMKARYRQWVENLGWDWCLSRQRAFGVPFPVWYCAACGEPLLAKEGQLPVYPSQQRPAASCACGGETFVPEEDVMDTWATSSLSPQIVGRWLTDPELHQEVFPMSLRPQAHDIIRTWAFYTIYKSFHHFGVPPWGAIAISGWGIAGEGMGKISKSRGGGPVSPMDMIERHSADAVRYWAASTGFGKDAVISEEKIQTGAKLVNKLWNVARFSERFLAACQTPTADGPSLSPADRWILSRAQGLVQRVTECMRNYDYAAAKSYVEGFFWTELADNYLEMAKLRLYDEGNTSREGARCALYHALLTVLKLFAPFLPHVTEEIYRGLYAGPEGQESLHSSPWPAARPEWQDQAAEAVGDTLVTIATAVRRFKSEHGMALSSELDKLVLVTEQPVLVGALTEARGDLTSITRARQVEIRTRLDPGEEPIWATQGLAVALAL
jgi:valyl-tRNA synthetase